MNNEKQCPCEYGFCGECRQEDDNAPETPCPTDSAECICQKRLEYEVLPASVEGCRKDGCTGKGE